MKTAPSPLLRKKNPATGLLGAKKPRKSPSVSPTQRALKILKDEGRVCQIVERWNQWARVRQDLLGFIDIIFLREGEIVGLQVTSTSNHSSHREKILAEPRHTDWLNAGGKIELWSFEKKANGKWERKIEHIYK